jgi:hypothetical protein
MLPIFSPRHIANKVNEKFDEYNAMAVSILSPLSDKYHSFSIWNVPSYLVQSEKAHSGDGIHFQSPDTVGKIVMVKINIFCLSS